MVAENSSPKLGEVAARPEECVKTAGSTHSLRFARPSNLEGQLGTAIRLASVPSDLQSGGAEGAHLQCAVDCKSTYSMPADYKSTGTLAGTLGTLVCNVILNAVKNLGNIRLAHTRSFAPLRMTRAAKMTARMATLIFQLSTFILLSSCTQEESILPAATDDVLAMMPADTPVGIKAELKDESGKMTDESGSTRTTATWIEENLSSSISHLSTRSEAATYYAYYEIHPDKEVAFTMNMPGASDADKTNLYPTDEAGVKMPVPFNTLANSEPFSTLRLKDFNLTEGEYRCVSRWTVLNATYSGRDNLLGWARLTADATTGQPVLAYGEMKRASAKVTIVVVDESGNAVDVADGNVTATLSLPWTNSEVIYTPERKTDGERFVIYLDGIITLAEDVAITPDRIGIATYGFESTRNTSFPLESMVTADGDTDDRYYGSDNNILATIVPATATHTIDDYYNFTPIENPQFTADDKLIITVDTDPDDMTAEGGTNGPQTTGTYSLKLSDVKLSDGSALTSLKSGEHYILTVTLRHNTLVSATATIGAWSQASASATLGGDNAKLPDNNSTNE